MLTCSHRLHLRKPANSSINKYPNRYRGVYCFHSCTPTRRSEHTATATSTRANEHGNWDDKTLQRQFLENLGNSISVTKPEDWYKVTYNQIVKAGGYKLLWRYGDSPSTLVTTLITDHKWLPWKFNSVPRGFWSKKENIVAYLQWLAPILGFTKLEDWYKLTIGDLRAHHGRGLLGVFGWSPQAIISFAFPNHEWLPWKFTQVPLNFWNSIENRKQYMDWLYMELKFTGIDDWYQVTRHTFIKNHGAGLISKYKYSVIRVLQATYPEHKWLPWKFSTTPSNFFNSPANWRQFFDWLKEELGIKTHEDWYQISIKDLIKHGGPYIKTPLHELLNQAYPEHTWDVWKFAYIPKKKWDTSFSQADTAPINIQKFFQQTAISLGIQSMEDWYKVKLSQLSSRQRFIISKMGGLQAALALAYPHHTWSKYEFVKQSRRTKHDSQRHVVEAMKAIVIEFLPVQ